jgi:outer membrane autotransporter protein
MIVGGSGEGAGVVFQGGNNNRLYNEGLITTVEDVLGRAIVASYGNDRVENYGTVIGNVDLGAGNNYFVNYGLVNAGSNFDMGAGNRLLNEGNFSIGGIDNVWATVFEGDFEQTEAGTLWFDIEFDYGADTADWLDIRGSANLDGALAVALHNPGKIAPGDQEFVLITSSNGFGTANLDLLAPVSAVVDFNLYNPSETQYALSYDVDFAASGLNRNQAAMGEHFNAIQRMGGTDTDMQALVGSIIAQPDVESLATAYDLLSPHIYAANQVSSLFSSLDFAQAMMSCPIKDGDYRFSREGNCTWMRISDRDIEYEASSGGLGATDYTQTVNFGFQTALTDRWHGGLAFGLEDSEYKIPLASRRDGKLAQIGAILKGRYGANQFNISATMGTGDYQIYRDMGMPYADDEYTRRDLRFYSAHLGYSYSIERGRWYLRPGIDTGWVKVDGERFREVLTGPAALEVLGTDDSYLTSRIDLQVGAEFGSPDKVLYRPYLKTAWTHVNPDTANEIRARLSGAPPGAPFFTQVLETDKNFVNVSLGMQMFLEENWAFNLVYDHTSAGDWEGQSYYAKVQYGF